MQEVSVVISRLILKQASSSSEGYSSWMRKYLSPKEYYLIKSHGLHRIPISELKEKLDLFLVNAKLDSNLDLVEFLIRVNNRLGIILKIIRSGFIGNLRVRNRFRTSLLLQILSYRISINKNLNLNNSVFSISNNNSEIINIFAPVCPDYSYIRTNEGGYRYTFESIGDGIGLVAQKAISNINILKELSNDLIQVGLNLSIKILIGDFEANETNLNSLNEIKSNFIKKIELSRLKIKNHTGIETELFTTLCLGLKGWEYQIEQLKHTHNLYSFGDLEMRFPNIRHDKKLISRLPLYKKWFGENANYKEIFYNQVLEYILMGNIIKNNNQNNSAILASDHKAMRDYYHIISKLDIISSSADY